MNVPIARSDPDGRKLQAMNGGTRSLFFCAPREVQVFNEVQHCTVDTSISLGRRRGRDRMTSLSLDHLVFAVSTSRTTLNHNLWGKTPEIQSVKLQVDSITQSNTNISFRQCTSRIIGQSWIPSFKATRAGGPSFRRPT